LRKEVKRQKRRKEERKDKKRVGEGLTDGGKNETNLINKHYIVVNRLSVGL